MSSSKGFGLVACQWSKWHWIKPRSNIDFPHLLCSIDNMHTVKSSTVYIHIVKSSSIRTEPAKRVKGRAKHCKCIAIVGHRKIPGAFACAVPALLQTCSQWCAFSLQVVELHLLFRAWRTAIELQESQKKMLSEASVTFDFPIPIIYFLLVSCVWPFYFVCLQQGGIPSLWGVMQPSGVTALSINAGGEV